MYLQVTRSHYPSTLYNIAFALLILRSFKLDINMSQQATEEQTITTYHIDDDNFDHNKLNNLTYEQYNINSKAKVRMNQHILYKNNMKNNGIPYTRARHPI